MAGDDPLVGGGHHEDVDQDNLLTPVVPFPELEVAVLTSKPVRYELKMIVSSYHPSHILEFRTMTFYLKKGNKTVFELSSRH